MNRQTEVKNLLVAFYNFWKAKKILVPGQGVNLYFLRGFQNKLRLFPDTAVTDLFYDTNVVCLLRGTNWNFKYDSVYSLPSEGWLNNLLHEQNASQKKLYKDEILCQFQPTVTDDFNILIRWIKASVKGSQECWCVYGLCAKLRGVIYRMSSALVKVFVVRISNIAWTRVWKVVICRFYAIVMRFNRVVCWIKLTLMSCCLASLSLIIIFL